MADYLRKMIQVPKVCVHTARRCDCRLTRCRRQVVDLPDLLSFMTTVEDGAPIVDRAE